MTEMQVAHIIRADRFEIDSVPFTHDRVAVAFLLMGLSLGLIEFRVVRPYAKPYSWQDATTFRFPTGDFRVRS